MGEVDLKIVVGVPGDADEAGVRALCEAGADELFVGFVPDAWARRYGFEASPNRRHRARAQVRSADHLARLVGAATACGVPVSLALNEHLYAGEQVDLLEDLAGAAVDAGVRVLILAALDLAPRFRARFPGVDLHASGEAPVYNRAGVALAARLGFSRVIFGREVRVAEMAALAAVGGPLGLAFEAFGLGEWCVYNGALCFTCHGYGSARDFCSAHRIRSLLDTGSRTAALDRPLDDHQARDVARQAVTPPMRGNVGGCALCALGRMRSAGVGFVKLPGRSQSAGAGIRLVRGLIDGRDLRAARVRAAVADAAFCDGTNCWHAPEPAPAATGEGAP